MHLQPGNTSKILTMDVREAFALQAAPNKALASFTQLHCDVANRPKGGHVHNWTSAESVGPMTYEHEGKVYPSSLVVAICTPDRT